MSRFKPSLIHWLLITTLFKQIVFAAITPMWHGPDEQAHFAQVQYFAEFGQQIPNDNTVKDLSQEIYLSEELLGTLRDGLGKNKFTHHPEYAIEYTNTIIGKYESTINNLHQSSRVDFTKFEATRYPPLFYWLSAWFYRLTYSQGLIDRVFATRLASVFMTVALVWVSYATALAIFGRQKLTAATIAFAVSFHPMLSFLGATVNSDNLMNLLYAILLYLGIKFITMPGKAVKIIAGIAATLGLGLVTKPHFVIAFPTLLLMLVLATPTLRYVYRRHRGAFWFASISLAVITILRLQTPLLEFFNGQPIGFAEVTTWAIYRPIYPISLFTHTIWTIRHTIAEVIPWYWGVFDWLGVTLPRTVNRIINRILIVASVGIAVWLWRHKDWHKLTAPPKSLVFLGGSAGIFFGILLLWDWLFVRANSFSFGMQGRYYFPTLTAHMTWLVVGLTNLTPLKWQRITTSILKSIGLGMISLNFIGLYTIAKSYYQLMPVSTLVNQISQYKPVWFKYPWILLWGTLYLISLIILLINYLRHANR